MGIVIRSYNKQIILTYNGYIRLKRRLAYLTGLDVGMHYEEFIYAPVFESTRKEQKYWDEFDKETEAIMSSFPRSYHGMIDYIFSMSPSGSIQPKIIRQLLKVIGKYNDTEEYGSIAMQKKASFSDFKDILNDCLATESEMEWETER